jgi:uncharacterized protein YcfL
MRNLMYVLIVACLAMTACASGPEKTEKSATDTVAMKQSDSSANVN